MTNCLAIRSLSHAYMYDLAVLVARAAAAGVDWSVVSAFQWPVFAAYLASCLLTRFEERRRLAAKNFALLFMNQLDLPPTRGDPARACWA